MSDELKTWFLGPRGENRDLLHHLMRIIIERAAQWRAQDGASLPGSAASPKGTAFEARLAQLLDYLERRTVPAFSSRYQAHMGWDLLLPGLAGHVVGLLFPSNNVAYEGSPGTTVLEMLVGADLCRMLGYQQVASPTGTKILPWGHLVGGGTIGNIEALWAARNLKFLPLALKEVLKKEPFRAAEKLSATTHDGQERPLLDLSPWELLNLPIDENLALPARASELLPPLLRPAFDIELSLESLNQKGIHHFLNHPDWKAVGAPKILLSHDNHYSFEKAAALLGLGQAALDFVDVDALGRINLDKLAHKLEEHATNQVPVLTVVANLGSTELGAVDDLDGILALRRALRGQGLEFAVHVDGAFGGYHASLLREDFELAWHSEQGSPVAVLHAPSVRIEDDVPEVGLSEYTERQFRALPEADSIAVDPHKLGFLPYPGGAICYRNSALRDLTKFSAPYLGAVVPQGIRQIEDRTDQFVGVFGVEGSRSGGAAAAAFLAHSLLRPTKSGYGRLSGKELYASKRVFAALISLNGTSLEFRVAVAGTYPDPSEEERLIELANKDDRELDGDDRALLKKYGPDLNLLCYLFNFRNAEGSWNQNLVWLHVYNLLIYSQLELETDSTALKPLIVSRTIFAGREGTDFIARMLERLNLSSPDRLERVDLVALRSAEWDPWLTEQDPKLEKFRDTLKTSARRARETVSAIVARPSPGVSELRAQGLSDLEIAYGIVGSLELNASEQAGITANEILGGLSLVQDRLALPGLPEKALRHFAGQE